ncbi:MAG: arsenate reductase [Halieaceae bacterium]|jgi:arsenate reductase
MLYLERGPSMPELLSILAKLDLAASQIVRRGEEDYKTSGLNAESTDQEILAAIVACPKLLERPIVVKGDRAVLGRPPENVLVLLVDG